jgi:hypothetical protein
MRLPGTPAGASVAIVEAGKPTRVTVVLANDPLRVVADVCKLHVGMQVRDRGDPIAGALKTALEREFNVVEVGQYWESVQGNPPPPTNPLSAHLVEHATNLATILPALAQNGFSTAPPPAPALFNDRCWTPMGEGNHGAAIMPTPIAWLNYGQTPDWFQPTWFKAEQEAKKLGHPVPVPPQPRTYGGHTWSEILFDHVKTMMHLTRCLQQPRPPAPSPPADPLLNLVAPRIHAWVLVNEAFDSTGSPEDLEFWSGKRCTKNEIDQARGDLVAKLLSVGAGADPEGLLLVNDFSAEFYPSPTRTNSRAQAKAASTLWKGYHRKASAFYRMMTHVLRKDGALHGRVGVGYQMHFDDAEAYLADKGLYRAALLRGIRMYKGHHVPVVITEMVVRRNGIPDDLATYNARTYSQDPTHPSWQENAAVYRDIIRTYYSEEGCNSVSFWGLYDEPADESYDVYGHLYDAGKAYDTGVVNPDGSHNYAFYGSTLYPKPSYFGVLNGIIDAVAARRGPKAVPNWLRRFGPE